MKAEKRKHSKTTGSVATRRDSSNGKFVTKKTARKVAVKKSAVTNSKTAAVTNDRYEMRIDSTRRANWERAKALSGFSTLKDYLTHLADQDAEKVIDKYDTMTLKNNVFDMFVEACENASKPNDKLLAAAKLSKEQGF